MESWRRSVRNFDHSFPPGAVPGKGLKLRWETLIFLTCKARGGCCPCCDGLICAGWITFLFLQLGLKVSQPRKTELIVVKVILHAVIRRILSRSAHRRWKGSHCVGGGSSCVGGSILRGRFSWQRAVKLSESVPEPSEVLTWLCGTWCSSLICSVGEPSILGTICWPSCWSDGVGVAPPIRVDSGLDSAVLSELVFSKIRSRTRKCYLLLVCPLIEQTRSFRPGPRWVFVQAVGRS